MENFKENGMPIKVLLNEEEIPRQWYNLAADLPTPMQPPLGPDGNPITPDMLAPVFPMTLITTPKLSNLILPQRSE